MPLDGDLAVTGDADALTFSFTVTNGGDESVEVTFPSGLTADVVVTDDGAEVWRWSRGQMFTQALQFQRFAPGESITYDRTWESPVPGAYTASATLEASEHAVTARTTVTVPPS